MQIYFNSIQFTNRIIYFGFIHFLRHSRDIREDYREPFGLRTAALRYNTLENAYSELEHNSLLHILQVNPFDEFLARNLLKTLPPIASLERSQIARLNLNIRFYIERTYWDTLLHIHPRYIEPKR
jgi:hypothetical protein